MSARLRRAALAAVLGVCGWACGGKGEISGRVVDVFGGPVQAQVVVVGLAEVETSNAAGRYEIRYVPGRFQTRVSAPGYLDVTTDWELTAAAAVEASDVVMVPMPPAPGLYRVADAALKPVTSYAIELSQGSALGIRWARRSMWLGSAEPTEVCAGEALYRRAQVIPGEILAMARRAAAFLPPDAEELTQSLEQSPLGQGVWRVVPQVPGSVVVLESSGGGVTSWSLEVKACGGK